MHGERRLASRSLDEYQTLVLCRCRGGCLSRKHFLDLRVSSLRDATACRGTRASTPLGHAPLHLTPGRRRDARFLNQPNKLCYRCDTELLHHPAAVDLYCLFRHAEFSSNLFVQHTSSN